MCNDEKGKAKYMKKWKKNLTRLSNLNFQAKFDHIEQLLVDDGTGEGQDGNTTQSLAQVTKPPEQLHYGPSFKSSSPAPPKMKRDPDLGIDWFKFKALTFDCQ